VVGWGLGQGNLPFVIVVMKRCHQIEELGPGFKGAVRKYYIAI
jgi:hypothetical protein